MEIEVFGGALGVTSFFWTCIHMIKDPMVKGMVSLLTLNSFHEAVLFLANANQLNINQRHQEF